MVSVRFGGPYSQSKIGLPWPCASGVWELRNLWKGATLHTTVRGCHVKEDILNRREQIQLLFYMIDFSPRLPHQSASTRSKPPSHRREGVCARVSWIECIGSELDLDKHHDHMGL